ncbi:ribonuclease J [Candidatus Paracaedibacter symbiosus]|uniref:ribonuclease J n=1 Tax=Candidatus Paracaedibacter symbiosus TaxID=244582 RepID=UPI0005094C62|nr:ribonuclease J [Candidatus Paracaedibacter symbiosus]
MSTQPTKKDFWFLPLGGSGEIGMNLNLYGYDDQWLMVDLGITFGDRLGIDIITPDPEFIASRREKLVGLVLTHAHEDHVGAIPYLWPELQCPIYATPFTAHVVRQKIKEYSWAKKVEIHEIQLNTHVDIGKFGVEFISLTHSIPEPNALAITTPLGTVMHTGDWKIDPEPLVGKATNHTRLQEWGDRGILAMVCDSTNVFSEGNSGSEDAVRTELIDLLGRHSDSRIIFSCFSSNIARVETAIKIAHHHNRKVCLVGRSLERMVEAARQSGYLQDIGSFIDETTAMQLPPQAVMIISTGSQGEPRSVLARVAGDQHPLIKLDNRDVVVFSSRVIPGNEKAIANLQNNLVRKGVSIITSHEEDIHVSGHPAREELKQMYEWVRPHVLIPVHGEFRHMQEQAELGLECGIPKVVVPENGTIVCLEKDQPQVINSVPVGRLGYDGNRLIPMQSPLVKERSKLSFQGVVFVTLVLDRAGQVAKPPLLSIMGITTGGEEQEHLERDMNRTIRQVINNGYKNTDSLANELKVGIRRICNNWIGKKPPVNVHIVQI